MLWCAPRQKIRLAKFFQQVCHNNNLSYLLYIVYVCSVNGSSNSAMLELASFTGFRCVNSVSHTSRLNPLKDSGIYVYHDCD